MKKLLIVSISIFILGFIFRLLHWPGAGFMRIIPVLLVLIFAIKNSFGKKAVWNIDILGGWVIFSWSLIILFKYMYWNAGPSIFGVNVMLQLVTILTIIHFSLSLSSESKKISKIVVITTFSAFAFTFVPSHSICYFFNLNEVLNKELNKTNYMSWDQYSWFLYLRGNIPEAIEANKNAIEAWHTSKEVLYMSKYEITQLGVLKSRKNEIINHTWDNAYIRPEMY